MPGEQLNKVAGGGSGAGSLDVQTGRWLQIDPGEKYPGVAGNTFRVG